MRRVFTVALVALVGVLPAASVLAVDPLTAVYETRGDLQTVFDETGVPTGPASGFLMNLEDWARHYGWQDGPGGPGQQGYLSAGFSSQVGCGMTRYLVCTMLMQPTQVKGWVIQP